MQAMGVTWLVEAEHWESRSTSRAVNTELVGDRAGEIWRRAWDPSVQPLAVRMRRLPGVHTTMNVSITSCCHELPWLLHHGGLNPVKL